MPQTTYSRDHAIAYEGMNASPLKPFQMVSATAQGAIPPGRLVCRDAADADTEGSLPDATTEVTAGAFGISMYDAKRQNTDTYQQYEEVLCMSSGVAWVIPEDAVVKGAQVFVRFATGTGSDLGAFRSDADTATAVALPGARWGSSGAGGALTKIEINLP